MTKTKQKKHKEDHKQQTGKNKILIKNISLTIVLGIVFFYRTATNIQLQQNCPWSKTSQSLSWRTKY